MADTTQNDNESLAARLSRTEAQVRRIKIVLWVIGVVLLCALIPPLGATVGIFIAVLLIVAAVWVYIFGIMWLLDRYFGNKPNIDKLPNRHWAPNIFKAHVVNW